MLQGTSRGLLDVDDCERAWRNVVSLKVKNIDHLYNYYVYETAD